MGHLFAVLGNAVYVYFSERNVCGDKLTVCAFTKRIVKSKNLELLSPASGAVHMHKKGRQKWCFRNYIEAEEGKGVFLCTNICT